MVKDLNFARTAKGNYEAQFTSDGKQATIHVERKTRGAMSVLGNIPGMQPTMIDVVNNNDDKGLAFVVDVPAGMEVTLRCGYEVTKAKLMTEE